MHDAGTYELVAYEGEPMADINSVANEGSHDLTIALGRTAFDSSKLGAIDETRAVDPWDLGKEPNVAHFPHLRSGQPSTNSADWIEEHALGRRPSHVRNMGDSSCYSGTTAVSQPTEGELRRWAVTTSDATSVELNDDVSLEVPRTSDTSLQTPSGWVSHRGRALSIGQCRN